MKRKVFLILATSLLLIGCGVRRTESSIFDSITSQTTSTSNSSTEISQSDGTSTSQSSGNSSSSDQQSSGDSSSEDGDPNEFGYGNYNGYYGQLTWNNGEDLKQKLHDIIRNGWSPLKYATPNWETNTYADHTKHDFEYVDALYTATDIKASLTNTNWQREHAFAASLMTGQITSEAVKTLGRATDFHNLFAGESSANSSRGNKNYGVADTTAQNYTNRTTTNGEDGYSFDPKTFEPGNKDKGRVARAIFYMATMYKDNEDGYKGLSIVEENVNYDSNNCQFAIGHLSELINWSNTYAVDYLEMQHNESVYSHVYSKDEKAQGNRNPFVDYPQLVDYVYGNKQNEAGDLKYLEPSSNLLKTGNNEFSHYALESAKREFSYGETLTNNDFSVVSVKRDFTYEKVTTGFTHSLLNHTFSSSDADPITAHISFDSQTINYEISLNPMGNCSYIYENMKNTGIVKSSPNTDQNVSYGDEAFTINFSASGTITCTNTSSGGFKLGSKTVPVTKVVLTTKNSYTVNKAFISCYAANNDSSYTLVIKVGETTVYQGTVVSGSSGVIYGGSFAEATGQVSYTFTGTNALNLCSVAFNKVN